jgi:hypothetical protein
LVQGSDELAERLVAATSGRADTLSMGADRQFPGRIEETRGQVVRSELKDLAAIVEKKRGKVWMVPSAHMVTRIGVAATYRY